MDRQEYLGFLEALKHIRATVEAFMLNEPNGKDEQYLKNLITLIDKNIGAYQEKADAHRT